MPVLVCLAIAKRVLSWGRTSMARSDSPGVTFEIGTGAPLGIVGWLLSNWTNWLLSSRASMAVSNSRPSMASTIGRRVRWRRERSEPFAGCRDIADDLHRQDRSLGGEEWR